MLQHNDTIKSLRQSLADEFHCLPEQVDMLYVDYIEFSTIYFLFLQDSGNIIIVIFLQLLLG